MVVKRIISNDKKAKITGSKTHKGKDITNMSQAEKDDLLKIIAEKMGLL